MARRCSSGRPYAGSVRRRLAPHRRALRFEPLEDRRVLAVVVVSNDLDLVNGDTSSIDALVADDGDDGISLREAILAANATGGADTITFADALSGQTITLGGTELAITEALTIDARPLAANVTIDANQLSRIFHITASTGDFMLGGLNLTGGRTTGNNIDIGFTTFNGGAIRSITAGTLTIDRSTISGNSTAGNGAGGGGIFARNAVTLTDSTVSGNSTAGYDAGGGGIKASHATLTQSTVSGNSTAGIFAYGGGIRALGALTLTQSTVSGNSTAGNDASGGGISADYATLTQSTVSGNSTAGVFAYGGGIKANGIVTLIQSTVSGNSTAGNDAGGGGIWAGGAVTLTQSTVSGNSTAGFNAAGGGIAAFANLTLTQSTVSGNSTAGNFAYGGGILAISVTLNQSTVSGNSTAGDQASGGGIWALFAVTLTQSTITDNHATGISRGGGVYQNITGFNHPISINGSIVAGNTSGDGGADLVKNLAGPLTVNYSLIGVADGLSFTGNVGNRTGTAASPLDPLLEPLADNGGRTWTHALIGGSPAINAGDPLNVVGIVDQRGPGFPRVQFGRVDMGAYEFYVGLPEQGLVVDTDDDLFDGDFTPGNLSLREAVVLANDHFGADAITFAPALTSGGPATILLTLGELAVTSAVTIDGPGANLLTIDAGNNDGWRIFNIDDGDNNNQIDVSLSKLTLSGGNQSGNGGAIFTRENLTLTNSTLTGNRAFHGGAIYNASGTTEVVNSTISGNTGSSRGGGIYSKSITNVTGSTLSENRSTYGGGIDNALGGALRVANSTVTGNFADNGGGGIDNHGTADFSHSTVFENGTYLFGGGIRGYGTTTLDHTVVTGNVQDGSPSNLYAGSFSGDYNLVGTDSSISGSGNIAWDSPGLGPLADNGGPTRTHALLPGSPAIDAGDPDFDPDDFDPPLVFDQRGAPFTRVHGGRIDIGAVEYIPQDVVHALFGDYNRDGTVDAADYTVWRNTLGNTGLPPFSGADGNGDGDITQADYLVWRANYGNTLPPPGAGSIAAATAAIVEAITLDEQATTQEHTAQNTKAFDEALVSVGSDVALQFDSAATSSSRVAKSRLPIMERVIRFDAAQIDLLLAVSPADRAMRNEPTGPLHKTAESDHASDPDAALLGAFDAWFVSPGSSPS